MQKYTGIFFIGCLMIMASCHHSPSPQTADRTVHPNDSLFAIHEGSFQFSIGLPRDMMIEDSPIINLNTATGQLNIKIGDAFHLVITQEKKSMKEIVEELANDSFFENRILEQSDDMVICQQILPTGEAYYFQFYAIVSAGEKWYFVQSWAQGEFRLDNINRMKQATETIQ